MTTQHRREYIAKYNLNRYNKRKAEAIEILGGECIVCGSTEDLQFDHIDPSDKSFTLGKLWSASQEKFLEELTKCQLLCFLCHMAKTNSIDKEVVLAKSNRKSTTRKPRRWKSGILRQK
jgi:5-methylcytosine-specific restriction endonuclease McrA